MKDPSLGFLPGTPRAPSQHRPALVVCFRTPSPGAGRALGAPRTAPASHTWSKTSSRVPSTLNSLVRPHPAISPACTTAQGEPLPRLGGNGLCSLGLPTASHMHWPVNPVWPGASINPTPWLPSRSRRSRGGMQPLTKGVSFPATIQGRQWAAEAPQAGRHPPLPLHTLAWCPGIPAHSPELSSAGQPCWGVGGMVQGEGDKPRRRQASPRPLPMSPSTPHGPSIGCFMGYRGQAGVP